MSLCYGRRVLPRAQSSELRAQSSELREQSKALRDMHEGLEFCRALRATRNGSSRETREPFVDLRCRKPHPPVPTESVAPVMYTGLRTTGV